MSKDVEKEAIHCPHCEKAVLAKIIGREHLNIDLPDYMERYTLVRCDQCNRVVLLHETGEMLPFQDYQGDVNWDEHWNDPVSLYPPQEKVFDRSVPENVVRTYSESIKCLKAGAYTAATIMGRRTLEIVCNELGANPKSGLFKKIEELSKKDAFSGRVAQWADRLREIGNIAAHDPKTTFNKSQARLVLDFTEALIENSFVLERKFSEFDKYMEKIKEKNNGNHL